MIEPQIVEGMKKFAPSLFFILLAVSSAAYAAEEELKEGTGLPLPRFASLRADEVNLRTGPGTRYPIDWVFVREGQPVEITAEYDVWRRVRDWEGAEGWVHKSALCGHRTAVVTGEKPVELLENDSANARPVASVAPGAIGELIDCEDLWCKIKFSKYKGYLPKTAFWGAYEGERLK